MNHGRIQWGWVLAVVCGLCVVGSALADHHEEKAKAETRAKPASAGEAKAAADAVKAGDEKAKADPAMDAATAEMMKNAAPGPQHKGLEAMVGTWEATTRSWWVPGQEPAVSQGTSENRMVLGGRYLEMRFKGKMMDQPFEGYGLTGYDNRKKEYTTLWIDDSSTEMMTGVGSMDEKAKALVMKLKGTGPDGKPAEYRSTTTVLGEDKHVYSMFLKAGDKEVQVMEITYSRL